MFEKRTGEIITNLLIDDWGIDHIYGMPGDSINELMDDFRSRQDELQFIQVRHEEVGALAASSYAKLTGKVGVCLSIGGPGATHLVNGLYDAKADSAPVLALVGQVPSEEVGTGAFQEENLERMFDGVAVFNKRVQSAQQLPDLVNQALREAYVNNGVSVLVIPDDLSAVKQKYEEKLTSSVYAKTEVFPSEKSLIEAKEAIAAAEKPVILAGKGAAHAQEELVKFAETIHSPVILSLLAKGIIPDNHPLCMGQHGQIGTQPAYNAMKDADLLLMIGTSFPYRDFLPKDTKAIQIDIDPSKIGKHYPVQIGLAGSTKDTLQWLNDHIETKDNHEHLEKYQRQMDEWRVSMQMQKRANTDPINGPQVMYELEKIMPEDAIISSDVGNVTVWVARYLSMVRQKMVISGWLATMGCGLPGAIAGQLAYPNRQSIAVCGDGGFAMNMQDFITAVKYKLPLKVIVLNNSKIGMIQYEQEAMGHLHYATELGDMDFAKFAESCGGEGYRVEKREDLEGAMQKAFLSDKPAIIDVAIEDQAPLPGNIGYKQAVHYTEYLIKEFFESGKIELPPLKTATKRLFN
ncbi:pyruvate oxidase [Pontibacillus chungwhensis BH030062]|uniref:Pyruvate oxidase n=1 Tax=Pontibacillus chungwhensis BH030062 TaxID=1385513 RepID=A0A0A2VEK2_9BACI|nr:pyruvate oxidase [Pontibacillus chungwhensis]KGP92080.1 pyruvate oxidase [Pontibacillus chungwhensis BH030062]